MSQLEKEYGTSTDANQMAIAAKLHSLEYQGGDMKTYLFNFEMFTRKLGRKTSNTIRYATTSNKKQSNWRIPITVVRDAERTASGDINKLLSEL